MVKLPRDAYGGEAKFTPVQELKQVGVQEIPLNIIYCKAYYVFVRHVSQRRVTNSNSD